ncbi:2-dehydro-3-deoxygluconokinase [Glaciihabitans tibetensis]|uniref:2-dehydro-3-deoxygluconokinase n=1 Tax=Glaciihabitans tibetensis TaxID=1266600 RepID=A0A2T0VE12_9MICO|nr:sugar kinase [Glaciihabitans tibetensis]PRY68408.1 2-dehydro-3-deoxygluconokinase [Glaciihabitans tibetensis]
MSEAPDSPDPHGAGVAPGSALAPELLAVGETMAMVAPHAGDRLGEAQHFRLDAGGAESNVAAHVAALGHRAAWFSRLGDDSLGHRVVAQLSERQVDVSSVVFDPNNPTGVYFKDPGHGVRYYRAGSAASCLTAEDADAVSLVGVRILHVSGITAAISPSAAEFLDRMIDRAREAGVLVSFDVNHRLALWDCAAAAAVLESLARRADLVFTGRDEAESLWGTVEPAAIRAKFSEVPELVVKDGDIGASVYLSGPNSSDDEFFEPSHVVSVVDVVGAGDAFAGGYLAALLDGLPPRDRLRAGHHRAALTLQTTGDSVGDAPRELGNAPSEPIGDASHRPQTPSNESVLQ